VWLTGCLLLIVCMVFGLIDGGRKMLKEFASKFTGDIVFRTYVSAVFHCFNSVDIKKDVHS